MGTVRREEGLLHDEIWKRYMMRVGVYVCRKGQIVTLFLLSFKGSEQGQDEVTDCKAYITFLITKPY